MLTVATMGAVNAVARIDDVADMVYDLRISWVDVSPTDNTGNFTSGWLAGQWAYIENPVPTLPGPSPTQLPAQKPVPLPTEPKQSPLQLPTAPPGPIPVSSPLPDISRR